MLDREGKERVVRNEATFRDVNENIELGIEHDDETLIRFVCECGDASCARLIELTAREYEDLRAHPRRFAVVDGHVFEETEVVITRNERYAVVEKVDPSARLADATDPRKDAATRPGGASRP